VPVSPALSWNAPHWFTGHLMLNAPRHSDHHAHPSLPFPALRLERSDGVPMLPASLPVMAAAAMIPPVWHRVMDRRLAAVRRAAE
jgi:alkane 1-monooxygenase